MLLQEIKKSAGTNVKKSIRYIYDLADETGVDVSKWDVEDVFGPDLTIPVQEINKRFFAHTRRESRAEKIAVTEDQIAKAEAASQYYRAKEPTELITKRNTLISENDTLQNSINTKIKLMLEVEDQIAESQRKKIELAPIIKEILQEGFWTLDYVREEKPRADTEKLLEFLSDEIILQDPQTDGRDFKLNFGRIRIRIQCNGQVSAAPYEAQDKAILNGERGGIWGYFHPFVSNTGVICFGTGASVAAAAIAKRNYGDVFMLAQRILTTYPGGVAYVYLKKFFIEGKDKKGNRPWLWTLPKPMANLYGLTEEYINHVTPEPTPMDSPPSAFVGVDPGVPVETSLQVFNSSSELIFDHTGPVDIATELTNPFIPDFRCPNASCNDIWARRNNQRLCGICKVILPPPQGR